MQANTVTGKFLGASPVRTVGAKNYTVRQFWLDCTENPQYPNTPEFQLSGNNVAIIENIAVGQELEVMFRVDGRKYDKKDAAGNVTGKGVATNLNVYRVSVIRRENPVSGNGGAVPQQQPSDVGVPNGYGDRIGGDDDLPF